MRKFTIKQAREFSGYTVEKIADMLNISVSTYWRYETYTNEMRVSTAIVFAGITGFSTKEIKFTKENDGVFEN